MTNTKSTNSSANERNEAMQLAREYQTNSVNELELRFALNVALAMLDMLGKEFIPKPHTWHDDEFIIEQVYYTAALPPEAMAQGEANLKKYVRRAVKQLNNRNQA